jgi:drug/metabolite transporter (DMT)-like permease
LLSIIYGLLSALTWGAGDFTGGLASRKVGSYRSVFYAGIIGILFLSSVLLFIKEPIPNQHVIIFSALAGMAGTLGLILLYHAMSIGLMSIAAPVSALLAATIPVIFGAFTEGLPEPLTLIGFIFALFAVWMISSADADIQNIFTHLADLKLPLLAGMTFGFYFILVHYATDNSTATIWPLIISRVGGFLLIICYLIITKSSFKVEASSLPIISANGILDLAGNFFFILASRAGRLDVASVLSSLFPSATIFLAAIILKEKLTRNQWIGVLSALIAIVLMTI